MYQASDVDSGSFVPFDVIKISSTNGKFAAVETPGVIALPTTTFGAFGLTKNGSKARYSDPKIGGKENGAFGLPTSTTNRQSLFLGSVDPDSVVCEGNIGFHIS